MTHPRVSLVMSVFNGEKYLRPAIESVLAQSMADFELIVIDNASTDGTAEILDSYPDPRLVRLRNDTTLTITASLICGVSQACGDFIARLDADDVALPERFAKQTEFLDRHPDVALVGSNWIDLMPDGQLVPRLNLPPTDHHAIIESLATGNPFVHSTLMVRRETALAVGGYSPHYAFAQDYDLYLNLVSQGHHLAILPEPLVHLRHHHQQFSVRPETALLRHHEEESLLKRAGHLPGLSAAGKRRNRQALASVRVYQGLAFWRSGQAMKAALSWLRALITDPSSCLLVGSQRLFAGLLR